MNAILKKLVFGLFAAAILPCAAVTAFGRSRPLFQLFAHWFALVPGRPGEYVRMAYYKMTLDEMALYSTIGFGSFFAHPQARIGPGVYIGAYCIVGKVVIGERTQIASGVQILSGTQQHSRAADGRILGSEKGMFRQIQIGKDCWIGAAAVVMADLGEQVTIGAGSVVTKPIPAGSIAVGSPAKVIRTTESGVF